MIGLPTMRLSRVTERSQRPQDDLPPARMPAGGIRAEGQHEFAPYSQLFTRFRQSK